MDIPCVNCYTFIAEDQSHLCYWCLHPEEQKEKHKKLILKRKNRFPKKMEKPNIMTFPSKGVFFYAAMDEYNNNKLFHQRYQRYQQTFGKK